MRLALVLSLLLAPALASGQTPSLDQTAPFRGTNLPPTSAALSDEATATAVNPAGLSAVGPLQLFYVHERSIARNQVADGLYLAGNAFGLGGGVSVDWLRSTTLTPYRKTGWGVSFGAPNAGFALGASFNFFASDGDPALDKMNSVDLGLLARPARFLSLGAVVKNVNAPTQGDLSFPREYDAGVAVRPFGERLTLSVDYLVSEAGGFERSRLSYLVQGEVTRGLRLGAGFAHGFGPLEPQFQLAITADTSFLGATYAPGFSPGGLDHVAAVRFSAQRYPELSLSGGKFALIDVDDRLAAGGGTLSLIGLGSEEDPYIRLVRFLELALRDPELQGVVLKIDRLSGVGLGRVEELRQFVLRMRAAGKRVVALLLSAEDKDYLLASAATKVLAVPQATLLINGFAAHPTFLGGTMEKLGVQWNVARVGAYKTATEMFTRTTPSPEERETIDAYLSSDVRHFKAALQQGRNLTSAQVDVVWAEGLLTAERAKGLGLVDEVVDPQKLDEVLDKLMPESSYDPSYTPRGRRDPRWGQRKRVAIIPILGDIAGGKSRSAPLGQGDIAGAETIVKALDRAARDPRVAAIVLRVDSPGGDGLASDLIYRAVLDAKRDKPIIASMGDLAASGGYYASMGADEIFASPTTLTGSIGVFLLKPAVEGLAQKLGVNAESIKKAPLADLMDFYHPWTPEEQDAAQRWVDAFYDSFISEVASSRKLEKARVDAVARGRAWSGEDAKARGLVDSIGGLAEAIESAKRRGNVAHQEVELVVYGEAHGLLAAPGGEEGVEVAAGLLQSVLGESGALSGVLLGAPARAALPPGLRELAADLGVQAELLRSPGVLARMPFTWRVE